MTETSILNNNVDLTLLKPWSELLVEKRCRRKGSLDFAALHSDARFVITPISINDLPLGSDQCVLSAHQIDLVSACADGTGADFLLFDSIDRFDRGRMPDHVDAYVCRCATEVVEFGCIEAHTLQTKYLLRRKVLA